MALASKKLKKVTSLTAPTNKTTALKKSKINLGEPADSGLDEYLRGRTLLKPDDQLDIPESDLKEEVARYLKSIDPQAFQNVVEYSFKEGCFVPVPPPPPTVILVHLEGCAILKDSPEAQAQIAAGDWDGGEDVPMVKEDKIDEEDEEEEKDEKEEKKVEEIHVGEEEGGGEGEEEEAVPEEEEGERRIEEGAGDAELQPADIPVTHYPKRQKKLPNAFNFCERAALTYNNPYRDISTQTTPLPRAIFSGIISCWMIYDFYAEDFERQQKEKELKEKKVPPMGKEKDKEHEKKRLEEMQAHAKQMKTHEAAKILDRMICQNLYDEISTDYRYYEDPSDEFRREEGTLLPLWKFNYEKTKKLTVTEIQWNTKYYDLFAVTFGSYDFSKQPTPGALCLFTIKNPSYPEFIRHTDVSLLSVSIHSTQAYMIAVGRYDGNIAIYNTHLIDKQPQFQSDPVTNKHLGAVWQVRWGIDLQDGEYNVFSISCDGKVNNWVLMQNQLVLTTVITLTLPIERVPGPDGAIVKIAACASSITFHPVDKQIYLVGTEEGKIFKCNIHYSSKYLFTYEAHTMPVHKVSFNRYCPQIFLSCSGDWTVKIWEDCRSESIFGFDLGCAVGDAQWAPYSSSVFAAITVDGKCHIFDLNINKYKSICKQNVVSRKGRNRATKIKFNYQMPIVVVGDERGTITALKLSPNLRLKAKAPKKKDVVYEQRELEIMKLEKILSFVREPNVLAPPPDTESVKVD